MQDHIKTNCTNPGCGAIWQNRALPQYLSLEWRKNSHLIFDCLFYFIPGHTHEKHAVDRSIFRNFRQKIFFTI